MQDNIQRRILNALLVALRPLARALLRAGIGHREFSEISKLAFVEVATSDYGLRGRPTNISRVAVMTGLTRKEVRRLRNKSDKGNDVEIVRAAPMSIILHRWYTESDFISESGVPMELEFSEGLNSFSELVRRNGGDIPAGAMRTELKRINAIAETDDGKLQVLKRNVSGKDIPERLADGLSLIVYPANLALAHNTSEEHKDDPWVMRTATTARVRRTDISRVRRISSDRLAEFVESINDMFAAYGIVHDDDPSQASDKSVGVGVFYFEEDKSESTYFYKT